MLIWFRNDLRTHDNPALDYAVNKANFQMSDEGNQKRLRALFFISENQWHSHHWSEIKIDFIKRHVLDLVDELSKLNIELEIVQVPDFSAQITYLKEYCEQHLINDVIANSELEFNEIQRDNTCITQGIPLTLLEADVIVPKGKVLNKSGQMYKVFTPFKKAWLTHVKTFGFEYLHESQPVTQTNIATTDKTTADESTLAISYSSKSWPLARHFKKNVLPRFFTQKIKGYAKERDIPSLKSTSALSPYLATGVISPRYILLNLMTQYPDMLTATDSAEFTWLNEIIWREFYRHLVFHEQGLCKSNNFNPKYNGTCWPNNPQAYKAWCEGRTGYPLVDAAMRQLNTTGWMHNRLRMVVASFLTKHLLVDWRLGEKYFMQHLIDGDLAANNGGWQWAASTGCDAQPYFRVFNPIRQSERFDPQGLFIRKYLPELADIPDKYIHFPHDYIAKKAVQKSLLTNACDDLTHAKSLQYWPAIVDHKEARLLALAFYK